MRLVCIADTHGLHDGLKVPDGDLLLYAGDWSSYRGSTEETTDFLYWLESLAPRFQRVIAVAGNHDLPAEKAGFALLAGHLAPSVTYLNDSGCEVMSLRIWGSPFAPTVGRGWAFMADRGADIQRHWDLIPPDTQVLVTHGGPMGILDDVEDVRWVPGSLTFDRQIVVKHVGCANLLSTLPRLTQLKLTVHGHLHLRGGKTMWRAGVSHVNACVVDESYRLTNPPVVVDL